MFKGSLFSKGSLVVVVWVLLLLAAMMLVAVQLATSCTALEVAHRSVANTLVNVSMTGLWAKYTCIIA